MMSLQRLVELNCENLIAFISHLSLANYTNYYCKRLATSVVKHPSYASQEEDILKNKKVIAAIANAGHQDPWEEKLIPVSFAMLKKFCEIYERNLPPYDVILMKCATWMGMFCMMWLAEFTVHIECYKLNHAIPGLSVTFESWKANKCPITLFLEFGKHFAEVRIWFKRYSIIKPVQHVNHEFFVRASGAALTWGYFYKAFNHAIDHSPWAGLTVGSHSMQIGGATICHALKMDILDIQCLGRWRSDEFFKYIWGACFGGPQDLRATEQFFSTRQITHNFCTCTGIAKNRNIGQTPANIFRCKLNRDRVEAKAFGGVVPVQVRTIHYLAQHGNESLPHLSHKQRASPKWFHCYFRNDILWYTVATYLAYTRIRAKNKANPHGFDRKIIVPNIAFIANEDHQKAEEWLQAYHIFMQHTSEEVKEKMTAIEPRLQLIFCPKACLMCDPSILSSPLEPLSMVKGGQV